MPDSDKPSDGWIQARKDADVTLLLVDEVEMFFRRISAGTFRMGSRGFYEDEEPIHTVEITQDFYMASFPVTQAQYRVMARACREKLEKLDGHRGPEPSEFKGEFRPVEYVNWHETQTIARWLSERLPELASTLEGWQVRLATEAEWEYVCRAGTETEYWSGDGEAALAEIGWYYENEGNETHRVGERDANPWRLYEMHGNVWEWCLDVYCGEAYRLREHAVRDPVFLGSGDEDGKARVLRGGSWDGGAWDCRSAFRFRAWLPRRAQRVPSGFGPRSGGAKSGRRPGGRKSGAGGRSRTRSDGEAF